MNIVRSGPFLAIDTSGPLCAAALFEGGPEAVVERSRAVLDIGRGHAERVIGACEDALAAGGMSWRDVARIAVTVGPGSFTGVRAGVAAARGLSLSLGVDAIGVTTLEAMGGPGGHHAVALDARRGQLYAQGFGPDGAPLGPPMIDAPGALAARLPGIVRRVVGSGAPALVEAMRASGKDAVIGERDGRPMLDAQPDIADVAHAAARAHDAARAAGPAEAWRTPPVPLYLRGADAKLPGGIDPPGSNATSAPASSGTVA